MTISGVALSSILNMNSSPYSILAVSGQVILILGLDLVIISGDKDTGEPGLSERGLEVTGLLRVRCLIAGLGRIVLILRGLGRGGMGELPLRVLVTVRGEQGEVVVERGEAVRGRSWWVT